MRKSILTGAGIGGIVDALKDSGVPEEHAHVYAEIVRRGGTQVTAYRAEGWERFDPEADPYKPNQAEIDRIRSRGYLDAA